jgi:hypothetical protein
MAYININTGAVANDGTGDTIRSAFSTVNDNFQTFNDAVFAGTRQSIISAASVTGGYIQSNTYVLATTYVNADSIVGNTVTSYGNLFVSQDGAYIVGNVNIIGNLNVTGSQTSSASQNTAAPILELHYSATPLVSNDGKDIGTSWQYYDGGAEKFGFLGWQNTSESLVYLDDATITSNVVTAGTFGNVQLGSLRLANTTATTSTTTGALQVAGGAGIAGNIHTAGNVVVANTGVVSVGNITVTGWHVGNMNFSGADTIYINGSPVQTAATAFNGGTVGLATYFASTTNSTSKTTGAVTIAGGLGVAGNTFVSDIHAVGNNAAFRGNLIGTLKTNAQPSVTSLGTLTSLSVSGQTTTGNILPSSGSTFWIGQSGSSYAKAYVDTLDVNTIDGSGYTSTGVAKFQSNLLATSTTVSSSKTTGAIVVTGSGGIGVGGDVRSSRVYVDNGVYWAGNSAAFSSAPGGSDTYIQFNDSGVFGGDSDLVWNKTTNVLTVTGSGSFTSNLSASHVNVTNTVQATTLNAPTHTGTTGTFSGNVTAAYFSGTATQALYADLAEIYKTNTRYDPGTVVMVGGDEEVTACTEGSRAIGVISTAPAFLMNKDAEGQAVALKGRVPCKVIGKITKGDALVAGANGVARRTEFRSIDTFAIALETSDWDTSRVIEVLVL